MTSGLARGGIVMNKTIETHGEGRKTLSFHPTRVGRIKEISDTGRLCSELPMAVVALLILAVLFTSVHAQPPGGIIQYEIETVYEAALVADINPGPAHAIKILYGIAPYNQYALGFGGALYFQANDGQSGAELWRTAGNGAELVADIVPGPEGSAPHAFAVYQNALYFAATTPETGKALFRYDGTVVSLAADIEPGPNDGIIGGLTVYNGDLYFTYRPSGERIQVWRFDGISAAPVAAINQTVLEEAAFSIEAGARTFAVFDGTLFYILKGILPNRYGLWAYDGASVQKIVNLTGENDIVERAFDLGVYNDALYFGVVGQKEDGNSWERRDELWKYDGKSSPNKVAVLDDWNAYSFSQPVQFQVFENRLYFKAGCRLFRYDGLSVHNVNASLTTLPSCASQLSLYGLNQLYFTGFFNDWQSREPYFFDGTQASLIKNIMPDTAHPPGSFPTVAVQVGDRLYFFAEDVDHGRELWSVRPHHILNIYASFGLLWEDQLRWPMVESVRDLVLATYLVVEGDTPQLIARQAVRLPAEPEQLRLSVLEIDQNRYELPDAFGLLSVLFDRKTGDRLDVGVGVFGVLTNESRDVITRTATVHGHRKEFPHVMSARIQDLPRARPVREVPER